MLSQPIGDDTREIVVSNLPAHASEPARQTWPSDEHLPRFIALAALGMVISLALAFSVPAWTWLAPLAGVLMVCTTVGLYYLSWRAPKLLVVPPADSVEQRVSRYRRPEYRRSYLVLALRACSFFFWMGTISLILQWWSLTRDWDAFRYGLAPLVLGSLIYLLFAFMWGREGSLLDRALNSKWIVGIAVALGVGSVIALFWWTPALLGQFKVGQAAPWSEQWPLVRQRIEKEYPGAVLVYIGASREYDAPARYDAALETRFLFKRSDGTDMSAYIRDTNPEATLRTHSGKPSFESNPYTQADLDGLRALYSHIRIGPRDALNSALAALGDDTPIPYDRLGPSMTLSLDNPRRVKGDTFDRLGKPAVWQVQFWSRDPDADVRVWVDAETGEVLLREKGG
ncbi:MAG: hypothetical protein WCD37_03555 [Chloroflexia bacterium]